LDEEVGELHRALPAAMKYLSERHREVISNHGPHEGHAGDYVTTCVDDKACVFVTFEDGIARCALEKAWFQGETDWRKPLSCHLFPIRIDRGIQEHIRFEHLADCDPALEVGAKDGVHLSDFLQEPLVRAYGNDWFTEFREYCRSVQQIDGSEGK
jgi:hypothetical protein